jgi:hypothetical protein
MTSPEQIRATDLDSDRISLEVPGHNLPNDSDISAVEPEGHDIDTRGLVMLSLLRFSS